MSWKSARNYTTSHYFRSSNSISAPMWIYCGENFKRRHYIYAHFCSHFGRCTFRYQSSSSGFVADATSVLLWISFTLLEIARFLRNSHQSDRKTRVPLLFPAVLQFLRSTLPPAPSPNKFRQIWKHASLKRNELCCAITLFSGVVVICLPIMYSGFAPFLMT